MKARLVWLTLVVSLLSGCGFVHDEHLVGPYSLNAIDTDEQMSVYYDLDGGNGIGRIDATVYAVGWNSRYIVAKQHPRNNRNTTNFFYLDMTKDSPYADPTVSVTGPLTEAEFGRRRAELGLPPFQRMIRALD